MKYLAYSLFVSFLLKLSHAYAPWNFNGSTPGLGNIVAGRCNEYQVIDLDNRIPELQVNFICNDFVEKFGKIFAYKDPCMTNFTGAYLDLLEFIDNGKLITDKAMFWSGTPEIVHDFTHVNYDYVTLEDTFPGYFSNNLRWCGCVNCNKTFGIDYNFCNKSCDATNSWWDDSSRQFAKKANGTAYVLLNGTASGHFTAYWNGSHFGRIELPTLGAMKQVTLLQILVINNVDQEPKEKCGTGSLIQLADDAKRFGVLTECNDDPQMVQNILCAKYPNAHECKVPHHKSKGDQKSWKDASIALIAISIVLLITVIVLLVMYNRKAPKANKEFDYKQHTEA